MGLFNLKKLSIAGVLAFIAVQAIAQSPNGINYQAIARDLDSGIEITNENISVQFEIRETQPNGQAVYAEEHTTTTNEFGLFTLIIGGGNALLGDLSSINWSSGSFYVATLIDSGNGFEEINVIQLMSVPFAFHANTVSNPNDADADPENEYNLQLTLEDDSLSLTDLGGELKVDLSSFHDNDGNSENELITDFSLDGFELNITEAGTSNSVNLAPIIPSTFWLENGTGTLYHVGNERIGIGDGNSVANSTLDINGSISYGTQTTGSIGTLTADENGSHYLINNTGPVSIQLPNAINVVGREYVFIFQNNVNHIIQFLPENSTIQGAPTQSFPSNHGKQVFTVISFGMQGWYFKQGL